MVPKISEKCAKYTNEKTGQFAAETIEIWHANNSTGNTPTAIKNLQLILFHSPQPGFITLGDFKLKKTLNKATNWS